MARRRDIPVRQGPCHAAGGEVSSPPPCGRGREAVGRCGRCLKGTTWGAAWDVLVSASAGRFGGVTSRSVIIGSPTKLTSKAAMAASTAVNGNEPEGMPA